MPARRCALENLAAAWFEQTIWLRLQGCARLAQDLELLNHFRRSLGGALGRAASPEARRRPPSPCPWDPPCALDVFFREQTRSGGDGLPKPFVPLAEPCSGDLLAGLRVFGVATEWLPAVEAAFIEALRYTLPWKKLGHKRPDVIDRTIDTVEGIASAPAPEAVRLHWVTPLDAEKIDPRERPLSVVTRLVRRIQGLARWHDAELDIDTEALEAAWAASLVEDAMEPPHDQPFRSGTHRRDVHAPASYGSLLLADNLATLWPLLAIGERSGVGRGASRGRGRYRLAPGQD